MKILLIDTCGATGSVAIAAGDPEPVVVACASLPGRMASERLVLTIRELMEQSGVALQALDAVVVVHGPGSFTGVRVGLSAAKGLCEGLGLPLVAVSRLAVMAHLANASVGGRVLALMDAGRGDFYAGEYANGECAREGLAGRDELLAGAGSDEAVQVVAYEATVAEAVAVLAPRLIAEPSAEDALPLALLRIRNGEFDDVAAIDANYLRRTDAEIFAKPSAGALVR